MIRRKSEPPRGILKPTDARAERASNRYHPSADLAGYVEHYWSVQWDLSGQPPQRVETLPHPSVHMIFERPAGSSIAGVSRGRFSRLLEGEGGVFAVKFTPGGFYPFAGVPVSTFADRVVKLREVFGADAVRLDQAVRAESSDEARIAAVEDFLRSRRPEPDDLVGRVSEIVYAAAADRSIVKVEDLVERYGLGTRALQRLFARYVGASPKWVIQRYRLHEAAEQLAAGKGVKQSALALTLGYSDQAHFVRDFKRVVGVSPATYAKAR